MFQRVEDEDAGLEPEDDVGCEYDADCGLSEIRLSPESQLALALDLLGETPHPPITDFIRHIQDEYRRTVRHL